MTKVETTAAPVVKRAKTGGRKAGVPNRPKVDGAPPAEQLFATIKTNSPFPAYRLVRTDQLVPYARNARTHTEAQIAKIAASVKEFGFTNPVLTDGRKGIVAGHGRVLAAQLLGMDVVPSIELSHLTAAQRRAYVLADNRLAEDAGWDEALLASELSELDDLGFDLSLTGFNERELSGFMGSTGGDTDPDDAPEVEAEAVSELGNVWLLGDHRLVCGDCTALLPSLDLTSAILTDPPYGLGKKMSGGTWGKGAKYADMWRWDVLPAAETIGRLQQFSEVIIWGGNFFELPPSRCWLVWDKQNAVPTVADCELAWTNFKRPVKRHSSGRGVHTTGHPTQKPQALISWCLEFIKAPVIVDPYAGSGTTIIAAEMTGRIAHAIEIEPRYVDVAVRRWQAFTGKSAILETTGATFDAIAAERLPAAA